MHYIVAHYDMIYTIRQRQSKDRFGYGLSQEEKALMCKAFYYWPNPHPELFLQKQSIGRYYTSRLGELRGVFYEFIEWRIAKYRDITLYIDVFCISHILVIQPSCQKKEIYPRHTNYLRLLLGEHSVPPEERQYDPLCFRWNDNRRTWLS